MKALNRIDRNFIFQEFLHSKPTIHIIEKNSVLTFFFDQYTIANNIIELQKKINLEQGAYTILFTHKQRLISGHIILQRDKNTYFFLFPETLSLYDKEENKHCSASLFFVTEKPQNLPITVLDECPLFHFENDFLCEQNNTLLLNQVRSMLRYKNNRVDDFCVNRLYFFLTQLSHGNLSSATHFDLSKRISMLFLSERFVVFFVSESLMRILSSIEEKTISIKIGTRFISISLSRMAGLMHIEKNRSLPVPMVLIAFSNTKVSLEDKRFLYESVYQTKYGTAKK